MSEKFPLQLAREKTSSIPWEMIAPHERQAQRNHSQTLKRLAERGGLSPCEAVAVMLDRRWEAMEEQDALDYLARMADELNLCNELEKEKVK